MRKGLQLETCLLLFTSGTHDAVFVCLPLFTCFLIYLIGPVMSIFEPFIPPVSVLACLCFLLQSQLLIHPLACCSSLYLIIPITRFFRQHLVCLSDCRHLPVYLPPYSIVSACPPPCPVCMKSAAHRRMNELSTTNAGYL